MRSTILCFQNHAIYFSTMQSFKKIDPYIRSSIKFTLRPAKLIFLILLKAIIFVFEITSSTQPCRSIRDTLHSSIDVLFMIMSLLEHKIELSKTAEEVKKILLHNTESRTQRFKFPSNIEKNENHTAPSIFWRCAYRIQGHQCYQKSVWPNIPRDSTIIKF